MTVPLFDLDDVKPVYQDGIDTIILLLGKNCEVVCEGTKQTCPNCTFNAATGISTGVYNGTGPRPFANGVCPVCKNSGYDPVTQDTTVTKKYLIQRNVKPSQIIGGMTLTRPNTIARLKGLIADVQPLLAMKYIVLDSDNQTAMQERYIAYSKPEYSGNIVSGRYFRMFVQRSD